MSAVHGEFNTSFDKKRACLHFSTYQAGGREGEAAMAGDFAAVEQNACDGLAQHGGEKQVLDHPGVALPFSNAARPSVA